MNRTTALLLLGAVLLIVASLVGNDGAVARIASRDQNELAAAIDQAGQGAAFAPGASDDQVQAADTSEMVRPVVVESDQSDAADDEMPFEEGESDLAPIDPPDLAPGEINETTFDPRIG